ncbi:hypothetical protein PZ938_15575 [Luteipulveratus sp. YIM 133132]|uniref:hypothetical protein n=1 Tax=Luteipulveratus flavus TaxID=3031728 RepID=UPI0023AFCA72|nr:hypothetical protein [Luteipulveratus sp. YIM 133132]MDE9367036.1 hypothetical protein [Luteipulveratus sp. YIM 133132]
MRARVLAVLSACLLACGVLGVQPASAADQPSFTVNGQDLRLSTALGSAQQVQPGLYKATLPQGGSTLYAAVTRRPGETLMVSVAGAARETGRPYFASGDHKLAVNLVIPSKYGGDPTTCGANSSSGATLSEGDPFGTLTATNLIDGAKTKRALFLSEDCAAATTLYVEVTREAPAAAGTMPVELLVQREPRLTGTPDQPAGGAELNDLTTLSKDDAVVVRPGRGYSDASTLPATGTTQLDARLGETSCYKVRVGWGQRLGAVVQLPRPGARISPQVDTSIEVQIRNPQRALVDGDSASQQAEGTTSPADASVSTTGVHWSNRNADYTAGGDIGADSVQDTSTAGWYYVCVRADPYSKDETKKDVQPYPVQLTVQVTGTATAGPRYVDAANRAITSPPPGQLSVGSSQGSDGSSVPWARVGIGAVTVLLAAGAVVWALRARRRTA